MSPSMNAPPDSVLLPESLRNHPALIRLRASLRELAPDQALLAAADTDPVAYAMALSGLSPEISE